MKNVIIFDLDETIINSKHRTPNNPDGTLNLAGYIEKHTKDNVEKDTLLPLVNIIRDRFNNGDYIIILTARDMSFWDYKYLYDNNIPYHCIMSRDQCKTEKHYKMRDGEYKQKWIKSFLNLKQFQGKPVIMFDDAKPVKSVLRKIFPVLCAIKINLKLKG